jgi:hypothetical protein
MTNKNNNLKEKLTNKDKSNNTFDKTEKSKKVICPDDANGVVGGKSAAEIISEEEMLKAMEEILKG